MTSEICTNAMRTIIKCSQIHIIVFKHVEYSLISQLVVIHRFT